MQWGWRDLARVLLVSFVGVLGPSDARGLRFRDVVAPAVSGLHGYLIQRITARGRSARTRSHC